MNQVTFWTTGFQHLSPSSLPITALEAALDILLYTVITFLLVTIFSSVGQMLKGCLPVQQWKL
jgi:hypothetical protein